VYSHKGRVKFSPQKFASKFNSNCPVAILKFKISQALYNLSRPRLPEAKVVYYSNVLTCHLAIM